MKYFYAIPNDCLIVVILIVIFSCERSQSSHNSEVEFTSSYNLIGELSTEIPILSKGNVNLLVIDTFLVVQRREEQFFQIYSTLSYKKLGDFGKSGDGPNEFIQPYLSKQTGFSSENYPEITIYDHGLNRVTQANIHQLIEGNEQTSGENLDEFNHIIRHFYYKNQDFLMVNIEEGGRFSLYDYHSGSAKTIPYLPKIDFKIPDDLRYAVYRSAVVVNENKCLIAAAPLLLGQLDFFDLDGNYKRSTYFESTNRLKNNIENAGPMGIWKSKMYIADMDAKGDYIYGLSYDHPYEDSLNPDIPTNSKILVFDWDGHPVKELELEDGRYIQSFAVDEKNNRIYAYCPQEKDFNLVVYSMP